ncbi:MAG: hypothetical protein J6V03_02255 [Clostridia bacterium]|nr:hypothetical protein [Clostridia bacterium]
MDRLIISKKIYIILIFFAIVGVILLSFKSEIDVVNNSAIKQNTFVDDTVKEDNQNPEQKLKRILARVEGVGEVDVFINFRKDSISKVSVFSKEDSSNSETKAIVEGVIVVAQGGGNSEIVSVIRNSVSEIFCIPLHKVIVLKMSE